MHQLVPQNVIVIRINPGQGQHDAILQPFGDAAGSLTDFTGQGVSLAEVGRGRVQNERLAAAELVPQQLREPRVPALGHPGRVPDGFGLLRVVIDVEVLGLQHFEVELLVQDLVAAEILRLRGGGDAEQHHACN